MILYNHVTQEQTVALAQGVHQFVSWCLQAHKPLYWSHSYTVHMTTGTRIDLKQHAAAAVLAYGTLWWCWCVLLLLKLISVLPASSMLPGIAPALKSVLLQKTRVHNVSVIMFWSVSAADAGNATCSMYSGGHPEHFWRSSLPWQALSERLYYGCSFTWHARLVTWLV